MSAASIEWTVAKILAAVEGQPILFAPLLIEWRPRPPTEGARGFLGGECRYALCQLTGHRLGRDVQYPGPNRWEKCGCGAEFRGPADIAAREKAAA